MRTLDLKTAGVEIRQALDLREGRPSPFFFMVGAGISNPPVLLAGKIQEECEAIAAKYGKTAPPPSQALIDLYSHWFQEAYPQPEDRQRYLRKMMEKVVISRANFRLAHLLLDGKVTNLVVTTNFDDLLSRALLLFGKQHMICDHPKTIERIDIESSDIQIVHVHGSYWFYDCCNLNGEIGAQAKGSEDTSLTMLGLLDSILFAHSPLVVGYSGWEGDVFMTALKRRLNRSLRTNLYWFCYRRSEINRLPDWLRQSANLCVVAPPEAAKDAAKPGEREPSLEATEIFDELIRRFELKVPPLTNDPLGFFSHQLTVSLLGEKTDELKGSEFENDVYAIRSVVERLNKLSQLEKDQPHQPRTDVLLEAFRNAIRQSDNRGAIGIAAQIPLEELSPEQLKEFSSATLNAGAALDDNSDDELNAYNLVVMAVDRLALSGSNDTTTQAQQARALFNKGVTLGTLKRGEEAIAVYDDVVHRFDTATEPAILEQIARALLNKGFTLGTLTRREEAIAVYDEFLRRFNDATDPSLREWVAKVLVNRGFTLGTLNRSDEAIAVYEDVVRRFADATEAPLRQQVAMALFNKGNRLRALQRNEDAVTVYDDLLRRFADAAELAFTEWVSKAMVNKGFTLSELNHKEEAITVYDEVVHRFENAPEPVLSEQVGKALFNKGVALEELKRVTEAIAGYGEFIRRFESATDPALADLVQRAKTAKGNLEPPASAASA